jgi:hypothetical protein
LKKIKNVKEVTSIKSIFLYPEHPRAVCEKGLKPLKFKLVKKSGSFHSGKLPHHRPGNNLSGTHMDGLRDVFVADIGIINCKE